jgi:predicted hotdog family 3-hydroxylacyl-ACP dehydratase
MNSTQLDISRLIPHRGAMRLLDSVEQWDESHIVCRTTSHRRPDNPLRDDSGLRALCGIEYGAQAIAAHGALFRGLKDQTLWSGMLASARDVTTTRSHLDDLAGPLTIRATLLVTHDQGSVYDVEITGDGRTLMTGRLSVIMSIGNPPMAPSVSTEGPA